MELGFGIPIISGIPDSLTWTADSKAQDFESNKQEYSGFRIPKAKIPGSRKPDLYLTWGEIWFIKVKRENVKQAKETALRKQEGISVKERFSNKNRKGIRIPETVKFLLVESWILGFGIRNTAQGIQKFHWQSSKFRWQRLESSTWNPESTAWNTESKTVLDTLARGDTNQSQSNKLFTDIQDSEWEQNLA